MVSGPVITNQSHNKLMRSFGLGEIFNSPSDRIPTHPHVIDETLEEVTKGIAVRFQFIAPHVYFL